jgi:hypothetical protein
MSIVLSILYSNLATGFPINFFHCKKYLKPRMTQNPSSSTTNLFVIYFVRWLGNEECGNKPHSAPPRRKSHIALNVWNMCSECLLFTFEIHLSVKKK